jgi:DtxR family Mn-dependent transcriptional regulator
MSHEQDLADQDVEEVAEELWTLGEQGLEDLEDLRRATRVAAVDAAVAELERRHLVRRDGTRLALTGNGRRLAERQVRRHRLAEALFTTVLEVADDQAVNRAACVMEHVLSAGITDSICAFLGHPRACPHGKPIPAGECCRTLTATVEPLVQPLDRLGVGLDARIVYVVPRDPGLMVRLSHLGVVPGAVVHLQQTSPAAVLRVGETTVAVEPRVAGDICVRRAG